MTKTLTFEDGKYQLVVNDLGEVDHVMRHGEYSHAATRLFRHSKLLYLLVSRLIKLENARETLEQALTKDVEVPFPILGQAAEVYNMSRKESIRGCLQMLPKNK